MESPILTIPPEILLHIGEKITHRVDLECLLLVCRKFRQTFTPLVHAEKSMKMPPVPSVHYRSILARPGLEYVKHLELNVAKLDVRTVNTREFSTFVTCLLKKMPTILSLRWSENGFGMFLYPIILKERSILQLLKQYPTLQYLQLRSSAKWEYKWPLSLQTPYKFIEGFRGLVSLELYNLFGNCPDIRTQIACVLSHSPGLKTLGLSLAMRYSSPLIITVSKPVILGEEGRFLEDLCMEFHTISERSLKLSKIRLGLGLHLFPSMSQNTGNYLEKLTSLGDIKAIYIYNHEIIEKGGRERYQDFNLLAGCTSVRHLSVSRLQASIIDWMNGPGQTVEELTVINPSWSDGSSELKLIKALSSVNLTSIFSSHVSHFGYSLSLSEYLPYGGSQLVSLAIEGDWGVRWENWFACLRNLRCLRELRLLLDGTWDDFEILAKEVAVVAVRSCPSIKSIMVNRWAWHVNLASLPGGNNIIKVNFVHMESEERRAIKIFTISPALGNCGLPLDECLDPLDTHLVDQP